jgi:hypothetical protein
MLLPAIPYRMRTAVDCGPAAISSATGIDYEKILASWPGGWLGSGFGRAGIPNDTPFDHFAILQKLGIPWRLATCGEILAGKCPDRRTIVLIHYPDCPIIKQHWVILRGVTPGTASIDMGNGAISLQTRASFSGLYADGWPACAYVVGEGSGRLSWWQSIIARLTGKFA